MLRKIVAEINVRKIVIMDTISHVGTDDQGQVVVSASHGGTSAAEYGSKVLLRAVFFNDAGVGKDDAGIAALSILQDRNVACCAYSHISARIGDATDAWESGIVSHVNNRAQELGVNAGDSVKNAARILCEGE